MSMTVVGAPGNVVSWLEVSGSVDVTDPLVSFVGGTELDGKSAVGSNVVSLTGSGTESDTVASGTGADGDGSVNPGVSTAVAAGAAMRNRHCGRTSTSV